MQVFLIAGARPNFMKIAPIHRASLGEPGPECVVVHTGQHYDYVMSQAFFDELDLPRPRHFLEVGSGSHAIQTARIMTAFETVCEQDRPEMVVLVGDVNSTLACSIVAAKMGIHVAHVEAGLRSFDRTMPEEINRIVTDSIADIYFVTEESGLENLRREGVPHDRIHFVGNVMIDNLFYQVRRLEAMDGGAFQTGDLKKGSRDYVFLTLHRPSNVDDERTFREIVSALEVVAGERPILFPMHPRTEKMLERFAITLPPGVEVLPPLPFMESLFLWKDAAVVMTDSGGLQEETTALGVPCVTLRENTERPVTVSLGTNIMGGTSREGILAAYQTALANRGRDYRVPPLWDGHAAERIWRVIASWCGPTALA